MTWTLSAFPPDFLHAYLDNLLLSVFVEMGMNGEYRGYLLTRSFTNHGYFLGLYGVLVVTTLWVMSTY
jgi:hypothetical protein